MGAGQRQTYYYKDLQALKGVAAEENIEINGNTFEELFWDRYAGSDEHYKVYVKALYCGDMTFKSTLMHILEIMAYTPKYTAKDNIELIKVVREAVGNAEWYEPADNYSDFRIENRWAYLDSIASIFGNIVSGLELRLNMIKEPVFSDLKPWEIAVQDGRYSEVFSNEANYSESKITEFKMKEQHLRSAFSEGITPGQAIDLIIEYWDYMWNFSSVYEAVEYCLTLTEKLNDKPMIRKKMRTFFINQSIQQAAINLAAEQVITDSSTRAFNRLLAYAEKFTK